jgi:hypothetical protein
MLNIDAGGKSGKQTRLDYIRLDVNVSSRDMKEWFN